MFMFGHLTYPQCRTSLTLQNSSVNIMSTKYSHILDVAHKVSIIASTVFTFVILNKHKHFKMLYFAIILYIHYFMA